MTLEDFERSLAGHHEEAEKGRLVDKHDKSRRTHRHHPHHKRKHYRDGEEREHGQKRSRRSEHSGSKDLTVRRSSPRTESGHTHKGVEALEDEPVGQHRAETPPIRSSGHVQGVEELKRDSWMEAPSALDIDYTQKGAKTRSQPPASRSSRAGFELKIHENELNKHHLKDVAEGRELPEEVVEEPAQHVVNYTFGDAGSQWRMTKLKNVFRQAEETGLSVDDVATDVYGDLRSFDDAKEEQVELERRYTYGPGYVGKEKPSGELFQERKLEMGFPRRNSVGAVEELSQETTSPLMYDKQPASSPTVPLDHTALNRLKARMMRAKLRGSTDASRLEAEYETVMAASATTAEPGLVVLGAMENRMLAGDRKGEVKSIDNKRGRERGLVEENEDMSIEDMVREERRTRHQAGGESQRFAERIAKDGKFNVFYLTCLLLKFANVLLE